MKTDKAIISVAEGQPITTMVDNLITEYTNESNNYRRKDARNPWKLTSAFGRLLLLLFVFFGEALPSTLQLILTIPMLLVGVVTLVAMTVTGVRWYKNAEQNALVEKLTLVKSALENKQEAVLLPLLNDCLTKINNNSYEFSLTTIQSMLHDFNIALLKKDSASYILKLEGLLNKSEQASELPNAEFNYTDILPLLSINVEMDENIPDTLESQSSSCSVFASLFANDKSAAKFQIQVDSSLMDLPIQVPAAKSTLEEPIQFTPAITPAASISFFSRVNQAANSLRNALRFTPVYPQVPTGDLDESEIPTMDDETRRLLTGEDEPRSVLTA